ncbi:MAG: C40 family peptidase [Terriglobia bacterium]|nr:C40 family peptidase [Terriglobia bacterium]
MSKRQRTSAALIIFVLLTTISTILVAQSASDYIVKVPVADMHSAPSDDSDVVSQAILGSNVTVLKVNGDWAKVRTDDQYTGWMPLNAMVPKSGAPAYGGSGKMAQVTSVFAHIYRETDVTKHAPLFTAPFDSHIAVIDAMNGDARWLKVQLPDGTVGYVQRGDVTLDPKVLTIPESIDLAKRFLGLPYTWGGSSSYGYDCSGFTQMLMRSRGIIMPRDADLQAAWSGVMTIKRDELKPGDLLFFGSSPDHITHTGMYIGNGEFIHATTHDHPVVQISRLDDQPWTRILVATRRVK